MTKQIEGMLNNMAENMDMDALAEQMNEANAGSEEEEDNESSEKNPMGIQFSAIPLGSIFSNMFGGNSENTSDSNTDNSTSSEKKKVKVEKKKDKRKKALETYGTNLTQKATK